MLKLVGLFWLALLLAACDPGGGPREHIRNNVAVDVPDAPFTLTGRVVKGVVGGAEVRVLDPVSGSLIASATTDSNGFYSLMLPAHYYAKPVRVRAIAGVGATVLCDLFAGCGGVEFGEQWPLLDGDRFELEAVAAQATDQAPLNVSVLTTIAARAADHEGASGAANRFQLANARVAKIFGLTGRLVSIDNLSLLEVAARLEVDDLAVRAALVNAALVAAANESGASVSEAIEIAVSSVAGYTRDGGAAESRIDQEDVLAEAVKLVSAEQLNAMAMVRATSAIAAELEALKLGALGNAAWNNAARPVIGSQGLAQVKGLVQEIRQIANSLDFASLLALGATENLFSPEILRAANVFGMDVTSDLVLLERIPQYASVMSRVMPALLAAVTEYYSNDQILEEADGIRLNLSVVGDEFRFDIQQSLLMCDNPAASCEFALSLQPVIQVGLVGIGGGGNTITFRGNVHFSGEIANEDSRLTFGEQAVINIPNSTIRIAYTDESETEVASLVFFGYELQANLPFELQYLTADSELNRLNSRLSGSAASLNFEYGSNVNQMSANGGFTFVDTLTLALKSAQELDFSFALTESPENIDPRLFVMNVKQADGLFQQGLNIVYRDVYECTSNDFNPDACNLISELTEFHGETEENFLRLALTLFGTTDLYGAPDRSLLTVSGERKSPTEVAINTLKVKGQGQIIHLYGQFNSAGGINALRGRNLDGAHIDIETRDRKRQGSVRSYSGDEFVDVRDMGEWLKFTYSDGSFDSL